MRSGWTRRLLLGAGVFLGLPPNRGRHVRPGARLPHAKVFPCLGVRNQGVADLSGLPATDVFQGTDEPSTADARTFHTAAPDARLYETPGGVHDFMAVPLIPGAQSVHCQIARNLKAIEETTR